MAWLTSSLADKAALQSLVATPLPASLELPEKRPVAPTQLWVEDIQQVAGDRYQVVVATTGGSLGSSFFVVPVAVDDAGAIAVGLPGRTRALAAHKPGLQQASLTSIAADDPAYQSAAGYVTANLTGSPELDRWTAPNSGLTAVSPRACTTVRIDDVLTPNPDDASPSTQIPVLVTAACHSKGRPTMTSQYGLVLRMRDGRWEVAAEDPARLLDPRRAPESSPPLPSSASPTPR